MENNELKIGDVVVAYYEGIGCQGVVTGFTKKRIKVYNEVRSLEGYYAPHNVEKWND